MEFLLKIGRMLEKLVPTHPPWWVWPSFLLALGVGAAFGTVIVGPSDIPEKMALLGIPMDGECGFKVVTGKGCPSCGMTRSWVWSSRLQIWRAFVYNPAGATLYWWLLGGGVVGLIRLVTRRPKLLRLPWKVMSGALLFWVLVLYAGLWVGRLFGFNALP